DTSRPITDLTAEQLRTRVADLLAETRARSAALTDSVDEADLVAQHSPLMSPLVWALAHVGSQEELWLVRDVGGREPLRPEIDGLYDAFQHPRARRVELPLLTPAETRTYIGQVRDKALDALERSPLTGRRLVEHGFAFGMIVQHEQQHDETMLATHQLRAGAPVLHAPPTPPGPAAPARAPARAAGGAGARRPVHDGHLHRAVGAGQRATGPPRRRARVRDRHRGGHQRRVRGLRRGGRLRRPALVERGGLGPPGLRGAGRAPVLAARRRIERGGRLVPPPLRRGGAAAARRAGRARVLPRGRGLRPVGGQAAAHRGG